MKLHRNAALSWQARRRRQVVEPGWTPTAAAEAAGVSVGCAQKWRALSARGRARSARSLLGATAGREPDRAERVGRDPEAAPAGLHRPEIADMLRMGVSTAPARTADPARPRAAAPLGAQPPGDLVHIDVKKLRRIGAAVAGWRNDQYQHSPAAIPTLPAGGAAKLAGNTSTSPSTTTTVSPTRKSSPTRRRHRRSASSAAPSPSTAATTASPGRRAGRGARSRSRLLGSGRRRLSPGRGQATERARHRPASRKHPQCGPTSTGFRRDGYVERSRRAHRGFPAQRGVGARSPRRRPARAARPQQGSARRGSCGSRTRTTCPPLRPRTGGARSPRRGWDREQAPHV
jgi:hypothetical protein